MLLFLVVFFLSFSSCTRIPPEEVAMTQHIFSFAKQMKNKEKMSLSAIGGSSQNHRQSLITLRFWAEKKLNLSQSRSLFVQTANEFLKQVNENEKLRPHLENYPITINNLHLSIRFFEQDLEDPSPEYISSVSVTNGKIYYSIWSKEKNFFEDIKVETWEEAQQIAASDKLE